MAMEERLKAGHSKLKPAEWKSGDRCWIVDVVAPFGAASAIVDSLKENVLAGEVQIVGGIE
jgi:cytolysin-activating lysine-acyltransferase